MLNFILLLISGSALAMSIFIGMVALLRSHSLKKNYFLLMQSMIIIYLLGYILELTSTNAEEAYTGVKVLYVGAYLVGVFAFFFIADFCNINIHPVYIKAPMVILAVAIIFTMWTTKFHHLIYLDYHYDKQLSPHLGFTPGPLYPVIHFYPTFCMILAMALLVYQMKKWENKYRKQLLFFFLCVSIPFIAEGIYFLSIITGINKTYIYFTPHSLALMSFCLYQMVLRFNIFEIVSIASVSAIEYIIEGFVLVDNSNNYVSANSAAVALFPGIKKLLKGESIFSTEGWPEELRNINSTSVEFAINGDETRYYKASISPVISGEQVLLARIILFRDITDNVNLVKELENAAYMDSLTELYNRKHFTKLASVDIERALRSDQSIYTAMLDLDFFKAVNDTYGHAAGDLVLKETAVIIRQTIRSYDLLGRYGGEEFVLLITNVDSDEAFNLMERIRENLEHSQVVYEGIAIKVTGSIGLAKFVDGDDLESSVKKADQALYAAKKMGRNQVQVYGS